MSRSATQPASSRRIAASLAIPNIVVILSALIAVLALIAAGAGLFWQGGSGTSTFTTLHGQTVELSGRGLYRYDTLFQGALNRGTDAVTLLLGIPLLVLATVLYRRGSPRGTVFLAAMLTSFLYIYASLALCIAYNNLFLLYVAIFSASFYASIVLWTSPPFRSLLAHNAPRLPRRGPAFFMLASGLVTPLIWVSPVLVALVQGGVPERMDSYTTLVTTALDLAIIVPAACIAGILILRRSPLGYQIAIPLLGIIVMLGPTMVAQTISQLAAGISFTAAEIAGPIVGFETMALMAIWVMVAIIRNISYSPQAGTTRD